MNLSEYNYRCDLHCYDSKMSDKVKELVYDKEVIRVKAHRINKETGQSYPAEQIFFVSKDEDILQIIHSAIEQSHIPSCWVSNDSTIDWSEYCDVKEV